MAANWMRRSLVVAACASAALLAACGSSTTESALSPTRFITFGDGLTDAGQGGGGKYSVNDGSINNWAVQLASRYGQNITPVSAGGLGYARGNARVVATPDAAGNAATLTVKQQIDVFLAGGTFGADDLIVISGGVSDVIVGMRAVLAGTQTEEAYVAAMRTAGQDYAKQIRRLSDAGARHILATGTYDLSRSPWATAINRTDLLSRASSAFNQGLLVDIVDLGSTVLYVDSAYYVNLMQGSPSGYGFDNATTPVCTSVDAGPGIGIGAGEVNSSLCNTSTLVAGANQDKFLFADKVYLTPSGYRQFGNYAYDRLRVRW